MLDIYALLDGHPRVNGVTIRMVRAFAKDYGISGFQAFLETNVLSESEAADFLASELKLDRIFTVHASAAWDEAPSILSYADARKFEAFPTLSSRDGTVCEVVVADPTRSDVRKILVDKLGQRLVIAIAERSAILKAIEEHYPIADRIKG